MTAATAPFPAGRPEVGRNHNSLPSSTPKCDVCSSAAVGLVTCSEKGNLPGTASFRSFRCNPCAATAIAIHADLGLTAKLERFAGVTP